MAVGLRLRGLLVGLLFWLGFMATGGLGDASDGCGLAGGRPHMAGSGGYLGCLQGGPGSEGSVQDHRRGLGRILELGWRQHCCGTGWYLRVAERYLLARHHWRGGPGAADGWLGGASGVALELI